MIMPRGSLARRGRGRYLARFVRTVTIPLAHDPAASFMEVTQ